eukprot:8991510-Pyramimonas_sp.AAC.1
MKQYIRGVVLKKGACAEESASFLALARVMDLLGTADGGDVRADDLATATHDHRSPAGCARVHTVEGERARRPA